MRRLVIAAALVWPSAAAANPTLMGEDDPHPGIRWQHWVDSALPARIQLVRIDLTSQEIEVQATKEADRGITTGAYAKRYSTQVAINGDSFAVAGYVPNGLAIGDGVQWSNTSDNPQSAVLHYRRVGDGTHERTYVEIVPPEVQINSIGDLPMGTLGAVSGRPLLVRNGVVETGFDGNDPETIPYQSAPRSAVGVTADGNTLLLVTVDGWQAGSIGMTAPEVASFLAARGASMAMMLDGGGASTLVMDGVLANMPSDGVQRPVANHLAIKQGNLGTGEVTGVVCKDDIIACRTDLSLRLPGAKVYLDDGRSATASAGDASFSFLGVTPRLVCVTAKKPGYVTNSRCVYLSLQDQPTYDSVALMVGTDPIDAGVTDANASDPDADTGSSGFDHDAGITQPTHPGGCCDAGSPGGSIFAAVFVLVALSWQNPRRSRYNR